MTSAPVSPFALPNIRAFIAFRVLFNARFYYPVFTILFLDYGLTVEQFALLNTVWAFSIVLAEVPSGALADSIGRRRLLIGASTLMVLEMLLLALVPLGNGKVVFTVFLLNRILSGLAEALASGADEALAYDSLVEAGLAGSWPEVLEREMRLRSLAHVGAMTVGALVYDPRLVGLLLSWLGSGITLGQQTTMRFPIYLTLVLAVPCVLATLAMQEEDRPKAVAEGTSFRQVLLLTLRAGGWIIRTPMACAIIGFAMVFDHCLRMLVTLASQYYRMVALPEASFGLIGSSIALLGLMVPRLARFLVMRYPAGINLLALSVAALVALLGLSLFVPYFGLIPMVLVFVVMMVTSFFTSHYLHQITDSAQRATVLSFKGMAYNLAYGLIGVLYAGLITGLRVGIGEVQPTWSAQLVEQESFRQSITWFPAYLALGLLLMALLTLPRLRRSRR